MMIGSMEDDHQWYDAARIEEVAAVTSGGLTISRAAWNQTASRQRCPFLLPEMKLSALGNLNLGSEIWVSAKLVNVVTGRTKPRCSDPWLFCLRQ